MKRILGILMCLLVFTSTVFAADASIENRKTEFNLKINYPFITLEDKVVSSEINRFIDKKMQAYRKVFVNRNYALGIVNYEVKYEDEDYLSIVFTYWWYYHNAAHGMYNTSGIIFDKHTGKLVNLKHFVPTLNVRNLKRMVQNGDLTIYNTNNKPVSLEAPFELDRVSHSYYIDADKNVYLIYQPYELASYADGNTYIKITQEDAKRLKE